MWLFLGNSLNNQAWEKKKVIRVTVYWEGLEVLDQHHFCKWWWGWKISNLLPEYFISILFFLTFHTTHFSGRERERKEVFLPSFVTGFESSHNFVHSEVFESFSNPWVSEKHDEYSFSTSDKLMMSQQEISFVLSHLSLFLLKVLTFVRMKWKRTKRGPLFRSPRRSHEWDRNMLELKKRNMEKREKRYLREREREIKWQVFTLSLYKSAN